MRVYKFLFTGACIAGILIMVLGGSHILFEDGLLGTDTISYLQNLKINHTDFFLYLLVRKLAVAGVLLLLSNTMYGIFSMKCFVFFEGMLLGMYLSAACIQYRMKGLFFAIGSFFPHQFILVPSWILFFHWCLNERYIRRRKPWMILWIFAGFFLGCLLESYVNPILLSDLVKIF